MIISILKSMKKDIEIIKTDPSEIKNVNSGINNTLGGVNNRLEKTEDRINDLKDKIEKKTPTQSSKTKKELKNMERVLKTTGTWSIQIQIMNIPNGKDSEQGIKNLFKEIMTENFPNLVKEIDIQVQEAQIPKQDEPKEAHTKTHHN